MSRKRHVSAALCVVLLAALASAARGADAPLYVPSGFAISKIAGVSGARELAFAPNGDLFVGTNGNDVYIVPHADAGGSPGVPHVFAHFDDSPAAGVALTANALYVGTQFGVWRIPYHVGDQHASSPPQKLASVRTSGQSEDHVTTSVAVLGNTLYASVGSNCNACQPTADNTRATIGRVAGGKYDVVVSHIRNPIALTVDENTNALWAGVAGEDDLPVGHPYEIFDDVSAHAFPATYGWPYCYENQKENPVPEWHGHSCSATPVPRVVFPAYETPIGAAFYPQHPSGKFAFAAKFDGGAFVALHGSWHGPAQGLSGYVPPRVVFVAMNGNSPRTPANWNDPHAQWSEFVSGYQDGAGDQRAGRPTGVAVGPQGDLFVADDLSGSVYRIRPK